MRGGRAVMHQCVGLECDQGVDVVGRGDAHRLGQTTDLADVDTDLGRVADPDPDELELGVVEHLRDHHLADETGTPDHDALGHARQPNWMSWRAGDIGARRRRGRRATAGSPPPASAE